MQEQKLLPKKFAQESPQLVSINIAEPDTTKTIDLTESILRYQNTCLATKIDYNKKHLNDQRKLITDLSDREYRYQSFFQNLYIAWTSFMTRNQRIHQMLKKCGECKLESKFSNAFIHLDQIFMSQNIFQGNMDEAFTRQISSKFQVFLKMIENIYIEIAAEYDQWAVRIIRDMGDYDQSLNNDYLRNLIQSCKEIQEKGKEMESGFKQKLQHKEKKVNDLDVQFGHQNVYKIQTLLAESRRENFNLTRRVRLLTEYNFRNIKLKSDEANDDIKNESYECVCGAPQLMAYKQLQEPQLNFIGTSIEQEEIRRPQMQAEYPSQNGSNLNINHLNQLIQKAVRNRNIKLINNEEGSFTLTLNTNDVKDLEQVLSTHYQIQQKCELYQGQNKKYSDQAIKLQEQINIQELKLQNCQEQFFQSDLFHFLQQHNKHLNDMNQLLTNQLKELQIELHDSIHSRQGEILNLKKFYENEINKMAFEMGRLRQDLQDKKQIDLQQISGLDIEHFLEGLKARNNQLQKVADAQMQEISSQKQQLQQQREKADHNEKKKNEFQTKISDLEQKIILLQSKLPEQFKLDTYQFRHQKHKDFILELGTYINNDAPQYRDKYTELSAYLRSRDQRVAELEKKIHQIQQTEILQLKRQQELMLEESEINQRTYLEIQKNSKLVEQQLKIKEQSEARIMQEKIAEKALFDNEKQQLSNKVKSSNEVIQKLSTTNQELQNLVSNLQGQKGKKDDYNYREQEYYEEIQKKNEEFGQQKQILQMENTTLKDKMMSGQLINSNIVREAELANQKVMELEVTIIQKDELLNSPKKLEQVKGYTVLKASDTDDTNLVSQIKQVACCSECTLNYKEVIIWKCFHMLCKGCGEKAAFKECCPICKMRINISDVWKVKIKE